MDTHLRHARPHALIMQGIWTFYIIERMLVHHRHSGCWIRVIHIERLLLLRDGIDIYEDPGVCGHSSLARSILRRRSTKQGG